MKQFLQKYRPYVIGIFLLLFVGSTFFVKGKEPEEIKEEPIPIQESIPITLKVDVKGAVVAPGVYEMKEGDRVDDVIRQAGGIQEGANLHYLNLSKRLEDQMTIYIYTQEEINQYEKSKVKIEYVEVPIPCNCPDTKNDACSFPASDKDSIGAGKISLNNGSKEELMTLTGIGEAKALDIIAYREKTPFQSIEDIKNVKGIGDSMFAKIKDQITL